MSRSGRAPVSAIRVVFLDDGGVLNDNERRAPEWRRLLGEFFPPRLGGTPDAWASANTVVIEEQWQRWQRLRERGEAVGPEWWPAQNRQWLTGMCERVGVPVPGDIEGTVRASQLYVMRNIDCAYPDAAPAMRAMHEMGIAPTSRRAARRGSSRSTCAGWASGSSSDARTGRTSSG